MTRLLLLRHGAVAPPWPDRIYGRLEVPLSASGEEEARRVVRGLGGRDIEAVVHSGLSRSAFTARLLGGDRGLDPICDERFLELDRGDWAGRDRAEISRSEPGPWNRHVHSGGLYCPGAAEGPESLLARVSAGLDGASELSDGGEVAVVAHMWVLGAAAALVLGLPADRLAQLHVPTAGLIALEWSPNGSRLLALGPDRI